MAPTLTNVIIDPIYFQLFFSMYRKKNNKKKKKRMPVMTKWEGSE